MLTIQRQKFCYKYYECGNATKSALYAGFSDKTATQIGYNLLQEQEIKDFLDELKAEMVKRSMITQDQIVAEYAKLGFSNIQDYMDENLEFKLHEIPRDEAAAISTIKKTVTEFEGGSKTSVEFKLHDKPTALNALGRHLGIFDKDNKQKSNSEETVKIEIVKPLSDD